MKKILLVAAGVVFVSVLCLCASSGAIGESDFFRFPIKEKSASFQVVELELDLSENDGFVSPDCIIRDSVVISSNSTEHLFSISDLNTGELVGAFCRRGKAWNELLSSLPLFETYEKSGELFADVFSFMDSKLFVWNISRSIETGGDSYESIVGLGDDRGVASPWMSYYRLDDSTLIAYDSKQVAMSYMPVYCILDLTSGKAVGYKISGLKGFSPTEQRWHFADVQADDEFVYALYSGEILFKGDGTDIPNILYVMDWNGNIVAKCAMNHRFTSINVDNGRLYLTNPEGALSIIDRSDIVK